MLFRKSIQNLSKRCNDTPRLVLAVFAIFGDVLGHHAQYHCMSAACLVITVLVFSCSLYGILFTVPVMISVQVQQFSIDMYIV